MKSVSGRDFARMVERRGWTLLRVNGSHHIYGKTGSTVRLSVPIHGTQALKRGGCCGTWRSLPIFLTRTSKHSTRLLDEENKCPRKSAFWEVI
jgi:predicted RNA binding protein YcfA (HicA-like mRNA interferase family)